jgi:hypothetical protein
MASIDLVQAVAANVIYALRCHGPDDALSEPVRQQVEEAVLDCIDSPNEELAGIAKACAAGSRRITRPADRERAAAWCQLWALCGAAYSIAVSSCTSSMSLFWMRPKVRVPAVTAVMKPGGRLIGARQVIVAMS